MEKVFNYEGNKIVVIKCNDDIWFSGKDVAKVLGYVKTRNAILKHVDCNDKTNLMSLDVSLELVNYQGSSIFINEFGLYSLIFGSKLSTTRSFKKWVTTDLLPTIKKDGFAKRLDHNFKENLTFMIENEYDLHVKVVSFLRKRYPHSLLTATLGDNQDTEQKRIRSFLLGYLRGSPDLVIHNLHKHYAGFAIEFKTPNGKGVLSDDQNKMLRMYRNNGFKILATNDYDLIILQISDYFRDVTIKCTICKKNFSDTKSICNHIESFHKKA